MNIALAGLTPREEVALGMLLGKSLPGWECLPASHGPQGPLPPADLYVVDLAGRGMARWTEAAQDELFKALDGAPAVLVAPAFDQSWSALDVRTRPELVVLHKPYGIEAMRAALQQAAASRAVKPVRLTPPAAPAPASSAILASSPPVAPARTPKAGQASPALTTSPRVEPAGVLPRAMAAPSTAEQPPPAAPAPAEGQLACSDFLSRVAALPQAPLLLRRLAESLARQEPFELRISFVNRMIFHPGAQWAASNTPAAVLQQLCQDDLLASSVEIDPLSDQDVQARAVRLDLSAQPLPALLWKLVHDFPGQHA